MKIESVSIDSIHRDPANVRKHGERNLDAIKASLARFGQQKPIVIDGDGIVRAGNGTLEAARALGWGTVQAVRTPLKGSEATAYAIADNRTAELAEWDTQALAEQLRALQSEDFGLDAVGYDDAEVDAMIEGLAGDLIGGDPEDAPEPQIDRAEELLAEWGVKSGQLWEIPSKTTPGKAHRLLCGDSTKAEDVARVMAGEKADLCFTSPPYAQQRDYTTGGIGDWDALMQGVFGNLPMTDAGQVLVNLGLVHRDGEWLPYWDGWIEWMRQQGWRRFGWYVWDQGWGLPGDWNGRFAPSHEFMFHFNKVAIDPAKFIESKMGGETTKGKKGLRGKDGNVSGFSHAIGPEAEYTYPDNKIPDSVIREHRQCGSANHPAPFSVNFAMFGLRCWPGIAYEPFSGSGTTLVAAEQTGRLCRAIEIAPKYVAVALQRLADMGLTPTLS